MIKIVNHSNGNIDKGDDEVTVKVLFDIEQPRNIT
jgi:hypothetical protein